MQRRRAGKERERKGADALKINFSVGDNMYKLNVTSYWYLLRWSQRNVEARRDITARLPSRISSR